MTHVSGEPLDYQKKKKSGITLVRSTEIQWKIITGRSRSASYSLRIEKLGNIKNSFHDF
ncbi:unnamed protein product [Brassica napus]|uniref:(rape) hypothetical protein n=1 Tax=Brassica napus TaxID=3708 RepID=A0A816J256_BRANA|nr:unnamed protein product [Brassica napus]